MNKEELRNKIYERLGLEIGSLISEGGNDWVRAEKEVLEEYRQKEFEKVKSINITDYLTIPKDTVEFISVLNSKSIESQRFKILLAQRIDLTENEINKLIDDGNKDILINLARYQKLTNDQILKLIYNSTYLSKKYLIENQKLSSEQKQVLIYLMKESRLNYSDLIEKIKIC